ncbi:MAG TPA: translocation/assembly module TamB domain-containing protein [Geminicoccus sp.]|uniref:translocation/assembly module TamB domain-containing protein n=1 Tax=Geminicoccus sp. TaxID=2024832 RepID=UPI002CBD23AC|nr:translocation/assembly module TamB domain-containing protein [Geminicoccus sp.]HWL71376.1 translocation/assembly module TamB domain-containing protein [Geminicoccus sp.]
MIWLGRLFAFVVALLAVPLGLVVLLLAAIQLPPVQDYLADTAQRLTAGSDSEIRITGLRGSLPFSPAIRSLSIADRDGVWLEAEDLHLDLAWTELFGGRVHVRDLSAGRVAVARAPVSTAPEPPPEPFSLPDPASLPRVLPSLRVDRLAAQRIELGQPLLGEPMVLALTGDTATRDQGQRADARFALQRIDQATLGLDLMASVDLAAQRLDLNLAGHETGGLIGRLAGLPQAGDLRLDLNGNGPLDDWRGRLFLDLAQVAALDGDLRLGLTDRASLGMDAILRPAEGILPADLAPLVGEQPELDLAATVEGDGSILVEQLDARLAAATLNGSSLRVPAGDGELAGTLTAELPELAPLAPLAGTELAGSAEATLRLAGTRERPAADLSLRGERLALDRLGLAQLQTDLSLQADSALGEPLEGGSFDLRLAADAPTLAGEPLGDGGPVTLAATGAAARAGQVRIDTLDLAGLGAKLTGQADLDTSTLVGTASLDGTVPSLASFAAFLPEGWKSLDGQAALDAEIDLTDGGSGDGASRLDLRLTGLDGMPAEFVPLLGDTVTVTADAVIDDSRDITLNSFTARLRAAELTGRGQIALEDGPLDLRLNGAVPDLSALSALAGMELAGQADLDVQASGTVALPAAELALTTTGLGGLPADLADLVGASPALTAAASRTDDGRLVLSRLDLTMAALGITGEGSFQPADGTLAANLQGEAAELGFLGRWLGGEPAGRATLDVVADGTVEQPAARLTLRAEQLAGLPARFADLLGQELILEAHGGLATAEDGSGRTARLDSLDLRTAAIGLTGEGELGLEDRRLAGTLRAEMPDLARAAAAAGTELAGSLTLDATASGDLDHPAVRLQLAGEEVQAAGRPLGRVHATLDAADLIQAPEGMLDLALLADRTPLTLKTGFAKKSDQVELRQVQLRGPGQARLDGDLAVDLAGPLASGRLVGGVDSLAELEPLVGQPLSGRLELDLRAERDRGQSARASVQGSSIALPGVIELGSLDLQAGLTDLLGTPRVDAQLVALDLARPDVDLDRTTVRAEGPLDALAVTLSTGGHAFVPVTLDAATTIRRSGEVMRLDLTRLEGQLAELPLRLEQPARVELAPGRTGLADLDLRLGQARVSGDASLVGTAASGGLRLEGLDLATLTQLGAPPLAGTVEAGLAIAGSTTAPRLDLTVAGRGLSVQDMAGAPPAPLDLDLAAQTTGRQATVTLDLQGFDEQPLRLVADLPLRLALQPFEVDLPMDGAIGGSLTGTLDLARVGRFAALDGQQIAGRLVSDLRFGGTILQPQANGSIDVRQGGFADVASGVAIRDLNLTVRASGQRIELTELSANGSRSGRLTGTGQANLGDPALPFGTQLRFEEFSPISSDQIQAQLSGTFEARGDRSAADLIGRIRINRADISIQDMGGGARSIPVIEVDDGSGQANGRNGRPAPPYPVNLDVVVDMPERIFVRGRGLDSEWGGRVQATGTVAEPVVTGQIEFRRGFIDFLDRRFNLTTGRVTLDGGVPPDPELDIAAEFKANTLTGILKVTGRASDPQLELTSDPVRPQDEIMAEILFGRDLSTISPAQGLRLAAAVNTLRGGGGPGIFDRLRQGLGVDTLEFGGSSPEDASVKAGRYISEDVYLQVERGVAPGSGRVVVEVEVAPNVTVQTETTEEAESGFGVQWRYDY